MKQNLFSEKEKCFPKIYLRSEHITNDERKWRGAHLMDHAEIANCEWTAISESEKKRKSLREIWYCSSKKQVLRREMEETFSANALAPSAISENPFPHCLPSPASNYRLICAKAVSQDINFHFSTQNIDRTVASSSSQAKNPSRSKGTSAATKKIFRNNKLLFPRLRSASAVTCCDDFEWERARPLNIWLRTNNLREEVDDESDYATVSIFSTHRCFASAAAQDRHKASMSILGRPSLEIINETQNVFSLLISLWNHEIIKTAARSWAYCVSVWNNCFRFGDLRGSRSVRREEKLLQLALVDSFSRSN